MSGPSVERGSVFLVGLVVLIAVGSLPVPTAGLAGVPAATHLSDSASSQQPELPHPEVDVSWEASTLSVDTSAFATPPGLELEVYSNASVLGGRDTFGSGPSPGVRVLRFYNGTMYASVPYNADDTKSDRIVALPDDDGDGYPDRTVTVLQSPEISDAHGFDFANGDLYVVNHDSDGSQNNIVRYEMEGLEPDTSSRSVLTDDLPDQGNYYHWTRTLEVRNGHLYVTAGSDSNVDEPAGGWYARMTRCDLDGTDCTSYADGLRNAVGFTFHDGKLFASDNGRDDLNDSAPPDEINLIQQGGDYGWPYCYGDNVPDPKYDNESRCTDTIGTAVDLRAHSVPLGLDFYTGNSFPAEYRGDLYVALHGSYDASPPRGYKIIRIPYDGSSLGEPRDFVTGWYSSDGDSDEYEKGDDIVGRPADLIVGPDGHMYISDDSSGVIYRLRSANAGPTAEFAFSPSNPEVGGSVSFDGSNSTDSDGSIQSYAWDFDGDGTEDAAGETASYTYASAGTYTASLTVVDDDGASDTTSKTVEVSPEPNEPPTANISVAPATPTTGGPVYFNGSNSTDPDGSIQSYAWDFDGDGTEDATGVNVSREYASYGQYTVALTVEDDDGATGATDRTIDVAPAPVCDACAPAADPDGDGKYEDVNGDGSVDVGDAQALFANTLDTVVQNNAAAFDFNDDGDVNVGDAQALFVSGVEA